MYCGASSESSMVLIMVEEGLKGNLKEDRNTQVCSQLTDTLFPLFFKFIICLWGITSESQSSLFLRRKEYLIQSVSKKNILYLICLYGYLIDILFVYKNKKYPNALLSVICFLASELIKLAKQ